MFFKYRSTQGFKKLKLPFQATLDWIPLIFSKPC